MAPYIAVLTGFGLVVLLTVWLPMVLKEMPLSLPIACLAIGAADGLPGAVLAPARHRRAGKSNGGRPLATAGRWPEGDLGDAGAGHA